MSDLKEKLEALVWETVELRYGSAPTERQRAKDRTLLLTNELYDTAREYYEPIVDELREVVAMESQHADIGWKAVHELRVENKQLRQLVETFDDAIDLFLQSPVGTNTARIGLDRIAACRRSLAEVLAPQEVNDE